MLIASIPTCRGLTGQQILIVYRCGLLDEYFHIWLSNFSRCGMKANQANSNEGHCICQVGKSRADAEVLLKNRFFSDPRKVCNGATRWQMSCKDYKLIAEK